MTLRGDITELPALRNDIAHQLDGIRDKRIEDNLWFDLDGNGHLTLASRPLSCLERFWEAVVRFFTNKYVHLEREFVWITDRVEEYLAAEKDPLQLGRFLNEYTPALNELYRTAARLGQVQRFSRLSLNSMKRKERIHDLVLTERLASSHDRRYQFHGYFFIGNNMENASVRFQVMRPDSGMEGLANEELRPLASCYLDVKSRANLNSIFASVKREHQMHHRACCISLDEFGQVMEEETSVIEDKGAKFWNKGDRPLRIVVQGVAQQDGEFILQANEHHLCPLPAEGDQILFTTSFTTETIPFKIGAKMGRYSAVVDRQGKLSLEILPLHIGLSGTTQRYRMLPNTSFESDLNNRYDLGLMTFRGNTGAQERIYVPRQMQAMVEHTKFLEWFGVRWDGILNATWSQAVCPLPLEYAVQGAQFTSSPLRVRTL